MDLVVNHGCDERPWFVESACAVDSPLRNWYWWRPPRVGFQPGAPGAEPTNWESFFSGPAWDLDPRTGEYYLHLFSAKQPDLNWENPEVRRAIQAMMRWWVDRGVDGFRMDVANLYSKVPDLPDGPVAAGRTLGDGSAFYVDGPRIHEFLAEMRRAVFAGRTETPLLVGETPGVSLAHARRYTDPVSAEVDMVFQFEHVGLDHGPAGKFDPAPLDRMALRRCLNRWQAGLADAGWNSLYWGNHDQPRAVSRFGDDGEYWRQSATALATVLYLQRGTPYLFQGEEIGMTNMPFTGVEQLRDIESIRYFSQQIARDPDRAPTVFAGLLAAGRDNARTPMQWSGAPGAGFTDGEPWIAINPNHRWLTVAAQRGAEGSVLEFYRLLIALRRSEPALIDGSFTPVQPEHPAIYAYARQLDAAEVLVVGNMSGAPATFVLGARWCDAELLLANYDPAPAVMGSLALRPWEALVLRAVSPV
jgi:oligo-1,6-glucosidase